MRKSIVAFLAVVACFGAVGVAQADAGGYIEYVNHVGVGSGQNYFGPYTVLYAAVTEPYGYGLGCAGIRGWGLGCPTESFEDGYYILSQDVVSEPYIHNHSTYTSYFNGLYFYE